MGQRLLRQGERDLKTARKPLHPETYYAAASFAHQAAEKALKGAYWCLRGEELPWKHDLVRCTDLLSERIGAPPSGVQEAVERLQPVYDESRYPSGNVNEPIPADLIGREDAEAAVRLAEEVIAWVRVLLQQQFNGGPPMTHC